MNLARAEQRHLKYQQNASQPKDAWFNVPHDQRLVAEDVETALTKLSDVERQIVISRIWGELTFQQIAELVDMSSSAVHRHFHRALDTMSSLLGEPSKK
jgi:RNA polymerase sigma-70 factor (ECF subfamily)